MTETVTVREGRDPADFIGVKSRVSWSAIFAGAVIALACCFVFTLLLGAVGISLSEAGVRANAVGIGLLVTMILTIVISCFLGGWVSSQLTAGENREEAVIYGFLTWAAATGIALCLAGAGVRAGYFAAVSGAMVVQNNDRIPSWEDGLRSMGISEAKISDLKATADPNRLKEMANDPATQERAKQAAMAASWTVLVGTMLSMAAAVGGALVGRGAAFRIFPVVARVEARPRLIIPTA